MIAGKTVEKKGIIIEPTYVVTRKSTETLAIEDPDVIEAVHFIRNNFKRPLNVAEVLERVPISRRSLEKKIC